MRAEDIQFGIYVFLLSVLVVCGAVWLIQMHRIDKG